MKKTVKLLALLLALVMVLSVFAGCKKSGGDDDTKAPEQTQGGEGQTDATEPEVTNPPVEEGKYGGHLNARTTGVYVDPIKKANQWSYQQFTLGFENVLLRNADNEIRPGVCNYVLSEDWLDLKLTVRPGATFWDGTDVTIADVKASMERAMNLGNTYGKIKPFIETMEIEGDTLHITFTEYSTTVWAALASYKTFCSVMPAAVCEKWFDDEIGVDDWQDLMGTGPYKMTDFRENEYVTYERREGYVPVDADPANTGHASPKMAYLDSITFWKNTDDASAAVALYSGNYDVTEVITTEDIKAGLLEANGLVSDPRPSLTGCAMYFNTKGKNNVCAKYKDLRKAIMAAVDYEEFLTVVTDDQQVMGGCPFANPALATDAFVNADYYGPANVDLAKEYLEKAREAGYADEPVQIVVSLRTDIPTMLQSYLDAAGIPCETQLLESTTLTEFRKDVDNNFDVWFVWPEYAFQPEELAIATYDTYWGNERKDELMNILKTTPTDSDEYAEAFEELVEIWVDDCSHAYMSKIYWYWFHPSDLVINDEGMLRYWFNTYWENPADHPRT